MLTSLEEKKAEGEEFTDWCEDGLDDSSDIVEMNRENRHRCNQFHVIGYRDGLMAGKDVSAQDGFDAGFNQSVLVGCRWGYVRGITSVLASLPEVPRDRLTGTAENRAKLEDMHKSVKSISTNDALKIFHDNIVPKDDALQSQNSGGDNLLVTDGNYEHGQLEKYISELEFILKQSPAIEQHHGPRQLDPIQIISSDTVSMNREHRYRCNQFRVISYRDGLMAGKDVSAQDNFNVGFHQSMFVGCRWGYVRGVTGALTVLPEVPRDTLTGTAENRAKLEDLHKSVKLVSTNDALKMFHNNIIPKGDALQSQNSGGDLQAATVTDENSEHGQLEKYTIDLEFILKQSPAIEQQHVPSQQAYVVEQHSLL